MTQENFGIGIFPALVRGREVVTDIAKGSRPENGVRQRMPARIGVGMALQARFMLYEDAAEGYTGARLERVNVKA